jgi:hypothetical protein
MRRGRCRGPICSRRWQRAGPGRVSLFDDAPTRLGDIDARLDAESMSTVNHDPVSAKFIGAATEPESPLTIVRRRGRGDADGEHRRHRVARAANRAQKPSR